MDQTFVPLFTLVCGIFFAAGVVKGVLGLGLPTLAMGLLGLVMPLPMAAGLVTVPSLATNVWQACRGDALVLVLARVWHMQLGVVAGVACAALLPAQFEGKGRLLLGLSLATYGVLGWRGWKPPRPRRARRVGAIVGAATGVLTALTGVFVLPAVPYLQSLGLSRPQLAQALGVSFTTSTLALAALLAARGQFGAELSLQSVLVLLPALAGMLVGQKLREDLSEAAFRRCFFGGLMGLGLWLAAAG